MNGVEVVVFKTNSMAVGSKFFIRLTPQNEITIIIVVDVFFSMRFLKSIHEFVPRRAVGSLAKIQFQVIR